MQTHEMCIRDRSHLDPDNKVSLFVRLIDRQSGEVSDTIINRY